MGNGWKWAVLNVTWLMRKWEQLYQEGRGGQLMGNGKDTGVTAGVVGVEGLETTTQSLPWQEDKAIKENVRLGIDTVTISHL